MQSLPGRARPGGGESTPGWLRHPTTLCTRMHTHALTCRMAMHSVAYPLIASLDVAAASHAHPLPLPHCLAVCTWVCGHHVAHAAPVLHTDRRAGRCGCEGCGASTYTAHERV